MSETNKGIEEFAKNESEKSSWDGYWPIIILFLFFGFGGCGSHECIDNELLERIAKLEGQMDIVSRRDK